MEETYCTIKEQVSDEVAERRNALFQKYVTPYLRMIRSLCRKYSFNSQNVEDNYIEVLSNLYKYIESYDTSKSIHTWLHIVTKRCVYDMEQRRVRQNKMRNDDNDVDMFTENEGFANDEDNERIMGVDNYRQLYSDDVLWALDQLKPQCKRALIYQTAGYKLKEIAEFEYQNGALDSKNIETIKSRLFWARQRLQELLTRDGKRRTEADKED